jgi:hypothetical protein
MVDDQWNMSSIASLSGGVSGLQASMQMFDRSASTVNRATALSSNESADASSRGGPDLIDGIVGTDLAAYAVKANIAVIRTADEMLGTLLDLHA